MTDTVLSPSPSRPTVRPLRAGAGAVATTIACVLPVFLVGGLAVQMGDDLGFSPAGLGLAVSVYFGVSALASMPSGGLVERYGPAVVARVGIALAAGSPARHRRRWPARTPCWSACSRSSAAANALGQLASNAALARHVPARRQGLSFGVKQAAIPASTLLAGAAVPAIALTAGLALGVRGRRRRRAGRAAGRTTAGGRTGAASARRSAAAGHHGAGGGRGGGHPRRGGGQRAGHLPGGLGGGTGGSPPARPGWRSPWAARSAWPPGSASAGWPTGGTPATSR